MKVAPELGGSVLLAAVTPLLHLAEFAGVQSDS